MIASWSFVHPSFAVAAAAVAILPVLIHLLNRRRYRRVPWAAMDFLRAATRRSASRIRLEQWLLLMVRVAVVSLLALALARPFISSSRPFGFGRSRIHRVLVIDNSCSMNAKTSDPLKGVGQTGESRLERAIRYAGELIGSFPAGDPVSVVTAASPARIVIGDGAYDRRRVRDRLGGIEPTLRGTDLAGGLTAALTILRDSEVPPGNSVVYIISDTLASSWLDRGSRGRATIELARRVAKDAALVLVNVSSSPAENVAITGLRTTSAVAGPDLPMRVVADVANYTARTLRNLHLEISVDSAIVRRLPIDPIPAGGSRSVGFSLAIDHSKLGTVKVAIDAPSKDALSIDDTRFLGAGLTRALQVLLVDGSSGLDRLSGAAGYLATALAPGAAAEPRSLIVPRIVSHRDIDVQPLSQESVIVLCNVPRLAEAQWTRLANFVLGGGGLLVFGGDRVDPEHYNRNALRVGSSVGRDPPNSLLPVRIRHIEGDGSENQFVHFAPDHFTHPALSDFADQADSGLFSARTHRFFAVDPFPTRSQVLLRYANGRPAVVTGSFGRGRVCMVTTSADMSWTNLPAKGDYVSLMVNLVSHLARLPTAGRSLLVGDTLAEPLSAEESTLASHVVGPEGRSEPVRRVLKDGAFSLEYGPIERVGTYAMTVGSREAVFAVNIDPRESDLRGVEPSSLRDALDCHFSYVQSRQGLLQMPIHQAPSTEVAGMLLVVVLVLLLVEIGLARRFGANR